MGDFALHIQCPWRIENGDGIVTGSDDLFVPASTTDTKAPGFDWDSWDWAKDDNLQDEIIGNLLTGYDPNTISHVNSTDKLVVDGIEADLCGGAVIRLSGGYRLVLFPDGSRDEHWRIFRPGKDERHFVVEGVRVESS